MQKSNEEIIAFLEEEFPKGRLVKHKADDRKMVIVGYSVLQPSLDYAYVSCQFLTKDDKYITESFVRASIELLPPEKP